MKIKREAVTKIVIDYLAVDIGTKTVHVSRSTTDTQPSEVSICAVVHHHDSDQKSITSDERDEVCSAVRNWSDEA
jgi:hypothetical protein